MKIVGVIQARMGSRRLPGKVMAQVAGAPLLARMLERVHAAHALDEVVVATSTIPADAVIATLCRHLGVPVIAGHPTDLLDRHYLVARERHADAVVKIPSDCPLIDPAVIDRVVGVYRARSHELDFVSNLHPATYPDGNDVEVMSTDVLHIACREATALHEREHTTPFIWDRPHRFRVANVTWETGQNFSMSHRFTVDYPEDLAFVHEVFSALHRPGAVPFSLAEILDLLERRPEVFALNRQLAGVNWYRHHLEDLRTVGRHETVLWEGR